MARRINIPSTVLAEIIEAWEAAEHSMKRSVLDRYAETIGCSTDTLYRRIRKRQGQTKLIEREADVPEKVIVEIERIKERGRFMGLGDRELATKRCIDKLRRRGVPEEDLPSVSTANRRLRERGYRERQRYRRVEADFALQQLQCDWSRSKYFQLLDYDKGADDYVVKCYGRHLAYKEAGQSLRTWVIAIKDSFSRLRYARMFAATGENYVTTLAFLGLAWSIDLAEQEGRVFCHAPLGDLQMDRGSTMKHKSFKEAIRAIGATPKEAQAKEAQGKIENQFRWLWTQFEMDLAEELGEGETMLMQDYNALLTEYCVREGQEKHPLWKRMTREQAYTASLRMYPPNVFDADLLRLAFTPVTRTINAYGCVSLNSVEYQVPEHTRTTTGRKVRLEPGTKVEVLANTRGEVIGRLIDRHAQEFRCTPWEQPAYGDFAHGPASTEQQRIARQVNIKQSGPDATREGLGLDAPKIQTLPHRANEVVPDSPFLREQLPAAALPANEARSYIGRRLSSIGHTYADAAFVFDELIGHATREDLDRVLDAYIQQRKAV